MAIYVDNKLEAIELAGKITGTSFFRDDEKSSAAGYEILVNENDEWISDLGNRIEINHKYGDSEYIHIKQKGDITLGDIIKKMSDGERIRLLMHFDKNIFTSDFEICDECVSQRLAEKSVRLISVSDNGLVQVNI